MPEGREGCHRVVALCFADVVAFDLAVAAEVFALAHDRRGRPLYGFEACASGARAVATTSGFSIGGVAGLDALDRADTVVLPGYRELADPLDPDLAARLNGVIERGGRAVSICTGAFALGHAGLLDGRRATTHWFAAAELAKMFPLCEVEPNALYVDAAPVLTSAGLSAGIDLCLHIVRRDHGEAVGGAVARAMVASPHRPGGQAQFIDRPLPPSEGSLAEVREWALARLAEPLDVAAMARRASMSPRTFARRFVAETGTTPLRWLHRERVLEARRLLERTELPIEQVATRAGFGSAPSLREHFRRATQTTPSAYRRAFGPHRSAAGRPASPTVASPV